MYVGDHAEPARLCRMFLGKLTERPFEVGKQRFRKVTVFEVVSLRLRLRDTALSLKGNTPPVD